MIAVFTRFKKDYLQMNFYPRKTFIHIASTKDIRGQKIRWSGDRIRFSI